jgi:hypothetical protein
MPEVIWNVLEFIGIGFAVCAVVSFIEDPEGFMKCIIPRADERKARPR